RRAHRAAAAGAHAEAGLVREHPCVAVVRDLLRAVLFLPCRHGNLARRAELGCAGVRPGPHCRGVAAAGGRDLAATPDPVQGGPQERDERVGGTGPDPGVHPGDRRGTAQPLRDPRCAVRRAGAVHHPQHHAAVAAAAAAVRHRPARRGRAVAAPGGRQSLRKYSTVVTTRTFLTCGLPWSRSLMVTTPWLALRIPPRREPESSANCAADSRAFAVASAISAGLMSLSLV